MRAIKVLMVLVILGILTTGCGGVWRVSGPGIRAYTSGTYVGPFCVSIQNGLAYEIYMESSEGVVKIPPGEPASIHIPFDQDVLNGTVVENGKKIGTVQGIVHVDSYGPVPWHITSFHRLTR